MKSMRNGERVYRQIVLNAALFMPLIAYGEDGAAADWSGWTLKILVSRIIETLSTIFIPLALAIVFFFFVLNIALYIWAVNRGEKGIAELSKKRLVYPVLALFVLFSIWGFVRIIQILFGG